MEQQKNSKNIENRAIQGMNGRVEADMQIRQSCGAFEEQVFAKYPLVGSKMISAETAVKLNQNCRKYIHTVLANPHIELPLRAKMQITMMIIHYAKTWSYDKNSNFWGYICLQFGFRDTGGTVRNLLLESLEGAMKQNKRLFLEDKSGREFKATTLIHAFSPEKSWMSLLDLLFDFYKNNLNWKVISGDPLIGVMVDALGKKLSGNLSEDIELQISASCYSFQEGVRKLVIFRPCYCRYLFEKLICRIDRLVNHMPLKSRTYEEQLCEIWFQKKLAAITEVRKGERVQRRESDEIALEYVRIHPRLALEGNIGVKLVMPDIRLKDDVEKQATLVITQGEKAVYCEILSWYGNELGKTLIGGGFSLPGFSDNAEDMDFQVQVLCDGEKIYDSEHTFSRRCMIFSGTTEIGINQVSRGVYLFVVPKQALFRAEQAVVEELVTFKMAGTRAYFVELQEGYFITLNGAMLAFDRDGDGDVRVILPSEAITLPTVEMENKNYCFTYYNSHLDILFGGQRAQKRYVLLIDGERVELSNLKQVRTESGFVYRYDFSDKQDVCAVRIIDLDCERPVYKGDFFLVHHAEASFDKEFYFQPGDYKKACYSLQIDTLDVKQTFTELDEMICIPYRDGVIRIDIPKIKMEETSGTWLNHGTGMSYIENIPQDSCLKVQAPKRISVTFLLNEKELVYDGDGILTAGNILRSVQCVSGQSDCVLKLRVSGRRETCVYPLEHIFYKEQFLKNPSFWTEGNRLYWDCGGRFIGKRDRSFILKIYQNGGELFLEEKIKENTEFILLPEGTKYGEYCYEVSIVSGGMFKKVQEVIAEGSCVIGDQNLLRFQDSRIVLDAITDESKEAKGYIPIQKCYIDQIQFQGIQDTSEGACPVYTGVLFETGARGALRAFSFEEGIDVCGKKKMPVNPVRIVYISESALCITDADGDGLYYCRNYDKRTVTNFYVLTDDAYTKSNQKSYSVADLYAYRKEVKDV